MRFSGVPIPETTVRLPGVPNPETTVRLPGVPPHKCIIYRVRMFAVKNLSRLVCTSGPIAILADVAKPRSCCCSVSFIARKAHRTAKRCSDVQRCRPCRCHLLMAVNFVCNVKPKCGKLADITRQTRLTADRGDKAETESGGTHPSNLSDDVTSDSSNPHPHSLIDP